MRRNRQAVVSQGSNAGDHSSSRGLRVPASPLENRVHERIPTMATSRRDAGRRVERRVDVSVRLSDNTGRPVSGVSNSIGRTKTMHSLAGDDLPRMRSPHPGAAFYPVAALRWPHVYKIRRRLSPRSSSGLQCFRRGGLYNRNLSYVVPWQGKHGPTVAGQVQLAFFFRSQGW